MNSPSCALLHAVLVVELIWPEMLIFAGPLPYNLEHTYSAIQGVVWSSGCGTDNFR